MFETVKVKHNDSEMYLKTLQSCVEGTVFKGNWYKKSMDGFHNNGSQWRSKNSCNLVQLVKFLESLSTPLLKL